MFKKSTLCFCAALFFSIPLTSSFAVESSAPGKQMQHHKERWQQHKQEMQEKHKARMEKRQQYREQKKEAWQERKENRMEKHQKRIEHRQDMKEQKREQMHRPSMKGMNAGSGVKRGAKQ